MGNFSRDGEKNIPDHRVRGDITVITYTIPMEEERIHSERLGEELVMRDFTKDDVEAMSDLLANADKEYLGMDYAHLLEFRDPARLREVIHDVLHFYGNDRLFKGIWRGDTLIGGGVLAFEEEGQKKVASVGGIARKGYEGQGLSEHILTWAKEEVQLRPGFILEATVNVANKYADAARRALVEKAGFKYMGVTQGILHRFIYEF